MSAADPSVAASRSVKIKRVAAVKKLATSDACVMLTERHRKQAQAMA
jgi:hypothetical protein